MKRLAQFVGPWVVGAVVVLLVLAIPTRSRAATCQADNALLGQLPILTGPTSTDWFNVLGLDFDPTVPPTLTFSAPVVPYPGDSPQALPTSLTSFVVPATEFAGSFKLTFRARDSGVRTITVRIAGKGCVASTVVAMTLPGTSTDAPAAPSPGGLVMILLVALGAAYGLWRRLRTVG